MNIPKFKSIDLLPSGSQVTVNFGWDIGPKNVDELQKDIEPKIWPRIHHAIDEKSKLIKDMMAVPFDITNATWIPVEPTFKYSVLRLINDSCELRILHINENEFDSTTFNKIQTKQKLKKGLPLAPCGNTGISFGENDGRHVHYSFYMTPGILAYENEMNDKFGYYWKEDKTKDLAIRYGQRFVDQIASRGIIWMNSFAIKKWDRYWGRNMYILNTKKVFE